MMGLTDLGLHLGWQGGLAGGSGAAALPALGLQQFWLPLGWGLVLAALVRWLAAWVLLRRIPLYPTGNASGRFHGGLPWLLAGVTLLWSLWPGPLSVSYWLGLAFQAPSGLAVVLACNALWRAWRGPMAPSATGAAWGWWPLALLGWVLLLDTMAWWPVSLYAWGFGPQALGWLLFVSLLPAVAMGWRPHCAVWAMPLALLLFVALRLPTGNVWDAVLDPWLWLLAQYLALQQLWRHLKTLRKQ
ncbi:MAG: hypothetical protein U5M53_07740 [Rhodoferax sp.]|nr:hypothetical protein [Rhodoferax sp.]